MERFLPNGDKQITYPDGVQAWIKQSDHSEQIRLVDGSTYCCYANGVQKRYYPNGDVEIRTNTYVVCVMFECLNFLFDGLCFFFVCFWLKETKIRLWKSKDRVFEWFTRNSLQ